MTKIVVISDTHGCKFADKIPECDILLHCGDISPVRDHNFYFQQQWFQGTFIPELHDIPAKNIVFIAGNHDYYLSEVFISKNEEIISNMLPSNVHYLRDSSAVIEGIKIYGTPWVVLPKWGSNSSPIWNFAKPDEELAEIYSNIPVDSDILCTHGPAFSYCDTILEHNETERLGSKSLLNEIIVKKPKYVFSAHIHSANHNEELLIGKNIEKPLNIKFRCVSMLNESYVYHYEPFVFNYSKDFKMEEKQI